MAVGVLFVLFAVSAVLMLLSAAAILLTDRLGSALAAAAVLGGVLLLLAAVLYLIWLRPAVAAVSRQFETVTSVAASAGEAIEWVQAKLRFLRLLLAVIRSKW